jgi:hypothetical protein
VSKPYSRSYFNKATLRGFENGRFKENARVIDANCMKFPILDVVSLGRSLWPLDLLSRHHLIRVRYHYDLPTQLTFDEARKEVCDLITERGWYTQGWENREEFVKRSLGCQNMAEFMNTISFYGKWVF